MAGGAEGSIVRRTQRTAENGLQPKQIEIVAGDILAIGNTGGTIPAQVDLRRAGECGHAGK